MIDVREIVAEVKERLEADRKAIRERLEDGPAPPGLAEPTDEEFMTFVEGMLKKYPEELIIMPDGRPIMASRWITALPYVEGGKQIVDRVNRIQRKGERDAMY